MKQLLVLFFLFIAHQAITQEVYNRTDENGMKQGYWVYLGKDRPDSGIPDTGKVEEGYYVNDRKEGIWIKYHEDGATIKLKGEFKNNRPNGHYSKYYANGKLRERGHFTKNRNLDTLERFFESGQLAFFCVYDSIGKQHGMIRKYNPDGSLECEYEAIHGTIPNPSACAPEPAISHEPKEPVEIERGRADLPAVNDTHTIIIGPSTKRMEDLGRGECYSAKVYNTENEIWQDGTFRDGKLWDGKEYIYDHDGILLKVKVYKNGVYHSDGKL
ncbi:MAG TPA: hypothetical protein VK151_04015 [Fluviicola sp.]|nr:hypothetical protein [Fluviicola sp.]